MENIDIIKERIEKIRTQKGMSIAELGRLAGNVSRSSMQNTLDSDNPTLKTLVKIAKALGVKLSDLIIENEEGDLTAIIEHKGSVYKPTTVKELKDIADELNEQQDKA